MKCERAKLTHYRIVRANRFALGIYGIDAKQHLTATEGSNAFGAFGDTSVRTVGIND